MGPEELEDALSELEQRVERLRALYEQYFMGIEKIEPSVLRKDVDRRFWVLRREQIRNTAMRFKLNTINQRYNTYQQYWQRCIREIDAGTYKRHLQRAEKRFGTEAVELPGGKTPLLHAYLGLLLPFNLSGHPAVAVPCGFSQAGLPIGLQLVGRPFDEATILRVAHQYQKATDWHRRTPPVA